MTDTDSASLMFTIIADKSCDLRECEMRNVFLENKIYNRLNSSHEFFDQFNKRDVSVRKQAYKFENIEHGIICAINVNPKEYHKLYGILYETKNIRVSEMELKVWISIIMQALF